MSKDIIDARICPYCNKPMPDDLHYRETCGKPECQAEHKRHQQRERLTKKREENKLLEYDRNTTNGTITLSIDELRRVILDTAKEVRTETEEDIFNKIVQNIDSRFNVFKSEVSKQLERIQQLPALEAPEEEPLLKDVNKDQFKRIEKYLKELQEITKENSFKPFNNHFKTPRHDQLKAKDGKRAEDWLKRQINKIKKNKHHSMDEFTP